MMQTDEVILDKEIALTDLERKKRTTKTKTLWKNIFKADQKLIFTLLYWVLTEHIIANK